MNNFLLLKDKMSRFTSYEILITLCFSHLSTDANGSHWSLSICGAVTLIILAQTMTRVRPCARTDWAPHAAHVNIYTAAS